MKSALTVFNIFQHSDEFFEKLSDLSYARRMVLNQVIIILLFLLVYGIIMGSYNGFLQSMVTGLKLPILIFLSLFICFPALFVIQYMIGSSMSLVQMANVILSGFTVFATIALSFAPIVVFFMITSENYAFLKLLHVAIFLFAGIFAIKTIINGLTFSCEKKNIYPKLGMSVFKVWIIIFAFVSSQLAWNLRPFIGSQDLPFELFRHRESNFYVAVIHSVGDLLNKKQSGDVTEQTPPDTQVPADQPVDTIK
jgi:hypothetical protein